MNALHSEREIFSMTSLIKQLGKMKYLLFLIIPLLLPLGFYGDSALQPLTDETKIYINPSQVVLTDQVMLALIGGEWIPIDSLSKDSQGYLASIKKDPNLNRWICLNCRYNNNGWDRTCQREYGNGEKCGHPRPW